MKKIFLVFTAFIIFLNAGAQNNILHFIFTSDVHFGLFKESFRGDSNVSAAKVNAAMVDAMNRVPALSLPVDQGIGADSKIAAIEAMIITGDFCNRQEKGIQAASVSWQQFEAIFVTSVHLKDQQGNNTKLLLTPGNHDISNTVGFHRPMNPLIDKGPMIQLYNLMQQPSIPKTAAEFDYQKDKIHYSVNTGGIHLVFADAWPDSSERVWMEKDLLTVADSTPVLLFTHSVPDVEARFFVNPNGDHSINDKDKFENLVNETFKDGHSVEDKAIMEQNALAAFITKHPNIKAYFHGHNNYNQFYEWQGPDHTIHLPCFRADSPMKGKNSSKDETKLSFIVFSIDTVTKTMTVRECLWNTEPSNTAHPIKWGTSTTLKL